MRYARPNVLTLVVETQLCPWTDIARRILDLAVARAEFGQLCLPGTLHGRVARVTRPDDNANIHDTPMGRQ